MEGKVRTIGIIIQRLKLYLGMGKIRNEQELPSSKYVETKRYWCSQTKDIGMDDLTRIHF